RVTIAFGLTASPANCSPPQFCPVYNEYQESGSHTYTWQGVVTTGEFRRDIKGVAVVMNIFGPTFETNASMRYGTKPTISSLSATPAIFDPDNAAQQTISVGWSTPLQNITGTIKIEFLNQSSQSILRTITLMGQTPGTVTTNWDGHADNGTPVA